MRDLGNDMQRLATMAEHLLDLERLDTGMDLDMNLATLVRQTVADLAPLLIASGRSIELEVDQGGRTRGDGVALGRVVTDLIQNAMEHGGQHVWVRVTGTTVEVEDDGSASQPRSASGCSSRSIASAQDQPEPDWGSTSSGRSWKGMADA
jgi:two-component system, OmpR family, sensor histidine kinase TctE